MTSRFTLFAASIIFSFGFANIAVAQNAPSPVSLLLKEKSKDSSAQRQLSMTESDIDEISLNLKNDKARYEAIEQILADNYGPATSKRRNLNIWELPNTDKTTGQSKMITIMAGEENGLYFVKLDRKGPRRGNNPRLYNAIQPQSAISLSQAGASISQRTRSYEPD